MGFIADVVANTPILSNWGNSIRNRVTMDFANVAERTAQWLTPPEGAMSYLRDVDRVDYYDGAAWQAFGPRTLAAVQGTANVQGAGAAVTIITAGALTIIGGHRIEITYTGSAQLNGAAGTLAWVELLRDATTLNQYTIACPVVGNQFNYKFSYIDTPPGPSHTYLVRFASTISSNGFDIASATQKRQLIVKDII
jgi:hypothetical protein